MHRFVLTMPKAGPYSGACKLESYQVRHLERGRFPILTRMGQMGTSPWAAETQEDKQVKVAGLGIMFQ